MINNKIGIGGAAMLLTLSRIFAEATALPGGSISYGMQRFTVILLSFLLTAAAYLPLIAVSARMDGRSPVEVIAKRSKLLSGFIGVLISVYLLFCAAETGLRAHYYASSTVFDSATSVYFYVFTGAAVLFAVYKGLEVSSRAGTAVSAILGLLLFLIVCALCSHIRINRLYPGFADSPETLFRDVMHEFSLNNEYVVFAVLCGNIGSAKKSWRSAIPVYLSVSCAVVLLMTFLYNTVFGRLVSRLEFPFYTLSSISDITLLHRINGIDVTVWVMAGLLRLALYALAFGNVVRACFTDERAEKRGAAERKSPATTCESCGSRKLRVAALIFAAAALGLSELFTAFPELYTPLGRIGDSGIPLAAAAVLIPTAAVLCAGRRRETAE